MTHPDPYQEKLDGLITGLREFADWLDEHRHDGLALPAYPDMLWSTQFEEDGAAAVAAIGQAFGVDVTIGVHHDAVRTFGTSEEAGLTVNAYHIPKKPPVDTDRVLAEAGDPRVHSALHAKLAEQATPTGHCGEAVPQAGYDAPAGGDQR